MNSGYARFTPPKNATLTYCIYTLCQNTGISKS